MALSPLSRTLKPGVPKEWSKIIAAKESNHLVVPLIQRSNRATFYLKLAKIAKW